MMAKRVMGKASFASVQDTSGRIQLFVQREAIGEEAYAAFKTLDVGDIVGANGSLFITQKGELSVRVQSLRLLTKSLRPLPEKFHGMTDQELRYRQRYVDLIVTQKSRDTFIKRAATIDAMRRFLVDRGYLEIESPMMQTIPGGAAAKPFITHHNALDRDLYLRVAQELPIKRALVGGFDRVFELNRVFRNEGLSTRHNPEFTMMECNEAYVDYVDYMDMTEHMLRHIAETVCGSACVTYRRVRASGSCSWSRLKKPSKTNCGNRPSSHSIRLRYRRCPAGLTTIRTSRTASSCSLPAAKSLMVSPSSTTQRIRPSASTTRSIAKTQAMKRRCISTPTMCAHSNTDCRPTPGWALVSIGWSCCSPTRPRFVM